MSSNKYIVEASAGRPYGHVPGHSYYDCDVTVRKTRNGYIAKAAVHWGSAQGYDEEHGRVEAAETGASVLDALRSLRPEAMALAQDDDGRSYVRSAFARALELAADLDE